MVFGFEDKLNNVSSLGDLRLKYWLTGSSEREALSTYNILWLILDQATRTDSDLL